jgi:eukaryotic-like serine/threonine-protein kinase
MGQVISGKYRLERLISSGGMGIVYAAHHLSLDRAVALKFIRPDLLDSDRAVERFRREALAAASVKAPQLAAVHDFDRTENGDPYIVMELLDGEDLSSALNDGPLASDQAVAIIREVCRGLGAVHARGLVHRDIKPRNIFLARDARGERAVKVLDFGLAKRTAVDGGDSLTSNGSVVGTAHYMSPEQARGEPDVDARTDVYALGAVLHEMLSGQKAHPGESYNLVVFHILSQDPRPLETIDDRLPRPLCALVRKAMARDKARRYSDAGEMGRALDALEVADTGKTEGNVAASSATVSLAGVSKPRRGIAVRAAAVALACLGAAAALWWQAQPSADPTPSQTPTPGVAAPAIHADPPEVTPAVPPPESPPPASKKRRISPGRSGSRSAKPVVAPADSAPPPPAVAPPEPAEPLSPPQRPAVDFERRNPYQ